MSLPLYAFNESYFSFERFDKEYDTSYLPAASRKIHINPDRIEKSIGAFSLSLQFIKEEDYSKAKEELRLSIRYWPEFLPAHFVLARVYEITGNKRGVLKHYKSYLSLLKRLHQDELRATKVLLALLGFAEFETYKQAYDMISPRLKEQRVAEELKYLQTVKAEHTALDTVFKNPYIIRMVGLLVVAMILIGIFGEGIIPDDIREISLLVSIPVVIIAMLWFTYNQTANKLWLIIAYFIYPVTIPLYIGKKVYHNYWLKYRKPRPGYWICKNCGAENPDIYKECSKCSFEKS
ncbi:MAG: zinc ribbon domain-containing protein [Candidatus Omnitrophota bacterium]|nr:MAG: zinc ribbon domain-containing protein [Candidatus Omnitrophota bacterium]